MFSEIPSKPRFWISIGDLPEGKSRFRKKSLFNFMHKTPIKSAKVNMGPLFSKMKIKNRPSVQKVMLIKMSVVHSFYNNLAS